MNDFMRSILYDLYYGNVSPRERKPVQRAEWDEINQKIEDADRYFMDKMSRHDRKRFLKLEALYSQLIDIEVFDSFTHGFKFAVMLMGEVYADIRE